MLKTSGVPFDAQQVLDAIYGPSEDPRWHSTISYKDIMPVFDNLDISSNNDSILLTKDMFERIDF